MFRAAPKRARPFPTTCDQPTPSPLPTSPHLRAALALRHRRVRDRRGPRYDTSRPAEACATPCDASHTPDPALILDCFLALRDSLGYHRFIIGLLAMETLIHVMYVVAIKDAHAWSGMTPGFLWSAFGILSSSCFYHGVSSACGRRRAPPENMVRCMANSYSALGFWRAWHRSYNLWIVRYLYIPLGGTKRLAATSIVVFTFVALWHDLSTRLLTCGAVHPTGSRGEEGFGDKWWYRHACAAGGVCKVLLVMGANLVRFVLGVDGAQYFARELISSWAGIRFLFGACACLFVGVQLMFEYREEELRQGIQRRC
ncbi:MBOAT, membrane-bound O-acyltransferase family-domain-containing protein [Lactarius sanguifluus]|nr:MBOAT, membrane-bound O-acyltransferase family-domain-containing protein [Lactarius sanguifluus]